MLAAEGATVLVHGLEPGQADATLGTIADAGGRGHAVTGDIRTDAGTDDLVRAVRAVVDRVDIVVNNYGIAEGSDWDTSDTASWHGSYDTNVVTAVRVTQAFLPDMRAAGWGRIVLVSTVGATRPGDRIPEYYTAKGALPSMAVGLAKHLAGHRHHGQLREPGHHRHTRDRRVVHRARHRRAGRPTDWASVEQLILEGRMANPSGRVATPEDVGRFIAFVVSEPGWHLNGAHLRFDGGAADAVT